MAAQYENGKLVTGKPIIKDLGLLGTGRPSILTDELIAKAQQYSEQEHETVPTLAGLCLYLKINKSTMYEWVNDNRSQAFTNIINDIQAQQEHKLITGSLNKSLDSGMSRFLLARTHKGYEEDQTSSGINVSITRDSVEISHKNQTLKIDTDK